MSDNMKSQFSWSFNCQVASQKSFLEIISEITWMVFCKKFLKEITLLSKNAKKQQFLIQKIMKKCCFSVKSVPRSLLRRAEKSHSKLPSALAATYANKIWVNFYQVIQNGIKKAKSLQLSLNLFQFFTPFCIRLSSPIEKARIYKEGFM